MNRFWPTSLLTVLALLALAACGQAASPLVPATATHTSGPAATATATVVWPTLQEAQPAQAAPNRQLRVTGSGGYLRAPGGAYNESNRTFALTFDGRTIGTIACYANRCEGRVTIPADAAVGPHQLAVEGGSSLAVQVIAAP